MSAPSVVVFDLGKVLVDFDYSIAARKLGPRARLPAPELQHLLCQSPSSVNMKPARSPPRSSTGPSAPPPAWRWDWRSSGPVSPTFSPKSSR